MRDLLFATVAVAAISQTAYAATPKIKALTTKHCSDVGGVVTCLTPALSFTIPMKVYDTMKQLERKAQTTNQDK